MHHLAQPQLASLHQRQAEFIRQNNPQFLEKAENVANRSAKVGEGGRYSRYAARGYPERSRYITRYGRANVGESCPPYINPALNPAYVTGTDGNAGTGRPTIFPPQTECEAKPPRCDCHVIGATTLANPADTDPPGPLATTTFATLTLDSGDAPLFVPYYIFVNAFQIGAAPNSSITGLPVAVLLQDSTSGREPNLRRASPLDPQFGICTLVYGEQKEIECVDWRPFASVNNQQLSLTFYNPQDFSVHICVDMWGLPAAAA